MEDCKPTPYTPKANVYKRKENIYLSQPSPYTDKKFCPPIDAYLLAEDDTFLLLENGYKILL